MKKEYVYKLRDKRTKEFGHAYNGRTVWTQKPKTNMAYNEDKYEIVEVETIC